MVLIMIARLGFQDWVRETAATAAVVFLLPGLLLAQPQKKKSHPTRRSTVRRVSGSRKAHVSRTTARRRSRHRRRRHSHLTQLHLQPDRVTEIQQALIRNGYLQGEPTGQWDDTTQKAMQKFQQANGFQPTGLPEAKPLMKLGLGPHPLPLALDQNLAQVSPQQEGSVESSDPPAVPNTPSADRKEQP